MRLEIKRAAIQCLVLDAVSSVTELPEWPDPSESFDSLGFDSLERQSLFLEIDDALMEMMGDAAGGLFNEMEMQQMETPAEIIEGISRKLQGTRFSVGVSVSVV